MNADRDRADSLDTMRGLLYGLAFSLTTWLILAGLAVALWSVRG